MGALGIRENKASQQRPMALQRLTAKRLSCRLLVIPTINQSPLLMCNENKSPGQSISIRCSLVLVQLRCGGWMKTPFESPIACFGHLPRQHVDPLNVDYI